MLKPDYYIPMTEEDERIYTVLVPPDHELRQIDRIIDFSPIRAVVADVYNARLGRPADDPEMMFRLEFLQYKYNLSDRAVIRRAQCTSSQCQRNVGRTVLISDYREEYAAARQHNQTEDYQEVRSIHAKIERKHAEKTRYHGARRARYWGLDRVTIQSLLTNIVVNVKRIVRLTLDAVARMTFALAGVVEAEVCPTAATS